MDSNVLIDYVAERFKHNQLKVLDLIFDEKLRISIITKIEISGYNGVHGEEAKMIEFLSNTDVIALDENVASATISLKKKLKIKTP